MPPSLRSGEVPRMVLLVALAILTIPGSLVSRSAPGGVEGAVTVAGLGATLPYSVYEAWQSAYANHRRRYKQVSITYKKVGSGSGRKGIINQPELWDFAGTDVPLKQEEVAQAPDLVIFPTLAGGVAIAYHLPMCKSDEGKRLNLSMDNVIGIFNATITNWNDTVLKDLNPNCPFPDERISVVARADNSGTTATFTNALSAFNQPWNQTYGVFSQGMNPETYEPYHWKPGSIAYFGPKNEDVSSLILSIPYTLGYMSAGDLQPGVSVAALGNRHGEFVTVTRESLQAAMDSKKNASSLTVGLVNPDTRGAYPISSYTYLVMYGSRAQDCTKATELMRYILWFMTDAKALEAADNGFATVSEQMVSRVQSDVLRHVTCSGRPVLELVEEQIAEETKEEQTWVIPVAVTVPIFLLIVGSMAGYILWQGIKMDKLINMDDWNIPIEDIVFFYDEKMQLNSQGRSKLLRQKSIKSLKSLGEISEGSELLSQILQWPGRWRANIVGIRLLDVEELRQLTRPMKKTMLWMRDSLINVNLVRFYGLTDLHGGRYVIEDFCSKGTVLDVLQNGRYNLTSDFKMSVALEIASGMSFLHVNNIVHGMLRSTCCMLDNKWTVKIGDWEYFKLLTVQDPNTNPLQSLRVKGTTGDKYELLFRNFWTAPELLRSNFEDWPSQACDVYSYAIILQELFTRDDPYFELAEHLTPEQILDAVVHNRLRPEPSSEAPIIVRQVMELAWSDIPASRPTFEQISKMLRRGRSSRKTIMDNMMEAMEDLTSHLEDEVEAKDSALQSVRSDLENLMADMVPPHVIASLASGRKFESKIHSALGLIMMEIVGWSVAMDTRAIDKALAVLDNLSTQLKQVAEKYQACCLHSQPQHFKTFVIGFENDNFLLGQRCHEVAHLAMDILELVSQLSTSSKGNGKRFSVRLSAHVGVVGTGTFGVTSPRFLLLGGGVDVGRALLANSVTRSVKISRSLYSQIEKCPEFEFCTREPEWITCNGTDIESFILTGRQAGNGHPVSSDTSVDSGVFVDRPGQAPSESESAIKGPAKTNSQSIRPPLHLSSLNQRSWDGTRGPPQKPGLSSLVPPAKARSVSSYSNSAGSQFHQHPGDPRLSARSGASSLLFSARRHSAADFRHSYLSEAFSLSRISEDSDTALSVGDLRQVAQDTWSEDGDDATHESSVADSHMQQRSSVHVGNVLVCRESDKDNLVKGQASKFSLNNTFAAPEKLTLNHELKKGSGGKIKDAAALSRRKLRHRNSSASCKDVPLRDPDIHAESQKAPSQNTQVVTKRPISPDITMANTALADIAQTTAHVSNSDKGHAIPALPSDKEEEEDRLPNSHESPSVFRRASGDNFFRPKSPSDYSITLNTHSRDLVRSGSSSSYGDSQDESGEKRIERFPEEGVDERLRSSVPKSRIRKRIPFSDADQSYRAEELREVEAIPIESLTARGLDLPTDMDNSIPLKDGTNVRETLATKPITLDTAAEVHIHYTNEVEQTAEDKDKIKKTKKHNRVHPT